MKPEIFGTAGFSGVSRPAASPLSTRPLTLVTLDTEPGMKSGSTSDRRNVPRSAEAQARNALEMLAELSLGQRPAGIHFLCAHIVNCFIFSLGKIVNRFIFFFREKGALCN
jgi:hypothetical protein